MHQCATPLPLPGQQRVPDSSVREMETKGREQYLFNSMTIHRVASPREVPRVGQRLPSTFLFHFFFFKIRSHYTALAGLKLTIQSRWSQSPRDLPASASQVLGLCEETLPIKVEVCLGGIAFLSWRQNGGSPLTSRTSPFLILSMGLNSTPST